MCVKDTTWSSDHIKCELNVLTKAEGSAMVSQGKNVVMAAVYGPYELKHQRIQMDDLAFQISYTTKGYSTGSNSKNLEELVKTACESAVYPKNFARHETTLAIRELQDGGSVLACAINAGTLAMINSCMETQHLVAAVTCRINKDGIIAVDPDLDTFKNIKMSMTVAFDSVNYNVVMINSEGTCTNEELKAAISVGREAAKEVINYFKTVIKKYSELL